MRWLQLAALPLVLITITSAAAFDTSPAGPRDSERVGVSTSTVWLHPGEGYRYLASARAAGIGWIREDFAWSAIEPRRGHFTWQRTDALMRNASRLQLDVLAVAGYAPSWASGVRGSDKYPPVNAADYARFVAAVSGRYGRGGTFWRSNRRLVPRPLTAIELWNEPWLRDFWQPRPDPAAYARLVRAAAVAVKSRHPRMTILASGDVLPDTWFASLLTYDPDLWRSGLIGGWSVHLYCQTQSPLDTTSPPRGRFDRLLLTRSLAQQAGADKPIWITEFGWTTDPDRPDAVTEQVQAQYERDALVRATTEWRSFVPHSFVFTWAKPRAEDEYNLIRPDGSARPAWQAIQSVIAAGG
jgi:polysaccharide biosynthesis protein PslG